MESKQYTCSVCRRIFRSDRPDSEAQEEYEKVFNQEMRDASAGEVEVVCDPCYQRMIREKPPEKAFAEYKERQRKLN